MSRINLEIISTREYIASAYASIFASTPISELQNRDIALSELQITGKDITEALEIKNGPPKIFRHSLDEVDKNIETALAEGRPLALAWLCRKMWGAGKYPESIGPDIWEVPGYQKKTLDDLIVKDQLVAYRDAPAALHAALDATFY